ncbi:MAG: PaaI family thioesterase, partial [Pseudomonadota bacterium]|nr:PaaI family thioesterase [Pseudomonadota bacterium]
MQMNAQHLTRFMQEQFPQVAEDFAVQINDQDELSVKMQIETRHLRPGQTVSGPSMFALADVTFYLAILQKIGPEALSVTTSAT